MTWTGVVRVAELTDGLVDPVVRGRGVFRALHDELVADLARREVEALGCVPPAGFGRVLLEGYRYEKALTLVATSARVRRDRSPRPSPGVQIVRETETGPDFDGLDSFAGPLLHTGRTPYGGSAETDSGRP